MNLDEQIQEQACLHALGALKGEELREFEGRMAESEELQEFVGELRQCAGALALALEPVAPPPSVRDRLLASPGSDAAPVLSPKRGLRVLPTPPEPAPDLSPSRPSTSTPVAAHPPSAAPWLPWAVAAAFAVTSAWFWRQQKNAEAALAVNRQEAAVFQESLQHAADETKSLTLAIEQAKAEMAQLASAQKSIEADRDTATASLRTATADADSLRVQIAQLKQQNDLSNARVAVLGSLIKKKPDARAASVWSAETQSGVLVVENLPALPPGRDYQLWVLDPTKGAPISAGVFQVDAKGAARVAFKPVEGVTQPDQFAVTEEKKGGVPSPTMNKLVLSGK